MNNFQQDKSRKGFNLIEAAIVLAIIGLVIGGIWVAAAAANENQRLNKATADIEIAVKNIQNLISISDSITLGDSYNLNATTRDAGVYPEDWINGTSITHPFGGSVSIVNYTSAGAAPRFDFVLFSVPMAPCIKLVVKISAMGAMAGSNGTGSSSRAGLGYMSVNYPSWMTGTFPVSIATATAACTTNSNKVALTFGYTRMN